MAGNKDGQTLFDRILLDTARGLTGKSVVDWHLKVKHIQCLSNQKLFQHSQHAKNQLNT